MKLLSGHISPETAYVVDDYPYGFRLRCKIRYWLDWHPKRGARFVSQTTNPKKPGEAWNKPKASSYCRFGGWMYLDDQQHAAWNGLTEYNDVKELVTCRELYAHTMPEDAQRTLKAWITHKLAYEQSKLEGAIKCVMTTTDYGSITAPGFGTPIAEPTVETTVLTSEFTADELLAIGRSLRGNTTQQIASLTKGDA